MNARGKVVAGFHGRLLDPCSAFYGTGRLAVARILGDHAENPFQVLIGTILSQRTRDVNTELSASARLFARFPEPSPSLSRARRS